MKLHHKHNALFGEIWLLENDLGHTMRVPSEEYGKSLCEFFAVQEPAAVITQGRTIWNSDGTEGPVPPQNRPKSGQD